MEEYEANLGELIDEGIVDSHGKCLCAEGEERADLAKEEDDRIRTKLEVMKMDNDASLKRYELELQNCLDEKKLKFEFFKTCLGVVKDVGVAGLAICVVNWFARMEKNNEYLTPAIKSAITSVLKILGIKI